MELKQCKIKDLRTGDLFSYTNNSNIIACVDNMSRELGCMFATTPKIFEEVEVNCTGIYTYTNSGYEHCNPETIVYYRGHIDLKN